MTKLLLGVPGAIIAVILLKEGISSWFSLIACVVPMLIAGIVFLVLHLGVRDFQGY